MRMEDGRWKNGSGMMEAELEGMEVMAKTRKTASRLQDCKTILQSTSNEIIPVIRPLNCRTAELHQTFFTDY